MSPTYHMFETNSSLSNKHCLIITVMNLYRSSYIRPIGVSACSVITFSCT